MSKRRGFTLIELMVALAVLAVILIITTGAIGGFLRMGTAEEQQNTLQQNFRFAVDSISNDARQAVQVGVSHSSSFVFVMTDSVSFQISERGTLRWVRYRVDQPTNGGFQTAQLMREHVTYNGDPSNPVWDTPVDGQPVTERIPELLKLYFINCGNRLFVVMVGQMTYFGKQQTVSLVSLVYTRNQGGPGT